MAKFTSTLLGLTLVTACSASQANAGLFDWFAPTPVYHTAQVARPYTSTCGPNGCTTCGPNGCSPCVNGQCGTTVRPSASYGHSVPSTSYYYPSTTTYYPASSAYYPSTVSPATSYYGSSYRTPCATGNCQTSPYAAPYNSRINGSPYYGGY